MVSNAPYSTAKIIEHIFAPGDRQTQVSSYVTLLRVAIHLGDLHRSASVHEITIFGFMIRDNVRKLYPRCKIVAQNEQCAYPVSTVIPSPLAEDYLILYPLRKPVHSMAS